LSEHQRKRVIGARNGALGEVLTLFREAFAMSDEFLTVEVGNETDRGAQNPIRADDACHATPREGHV
jgi:hypothetical protein